MMPLPVVQQLLQGWLSLLLGAGLGLGYDLLRALRRTAGRKTVTALLDFLFWIPAGTALFALGMGPGQGQLRLFMLLSSICGVVLYFCLLSAKILPGAQALWQCWANGAKMLSKPFLGVKKAWIKLWRMRKKAFQIRKNGLQ